MAGYIIRDREKTLVLPCRQVDQLLQAADGDAALLYLYLMRRTDAVTAEQIMQSLSMSALRLQAAQSRLEGMGLLQSQSLPVPEPARQPAEYTAAELGEMLRDGEFRMLVEETERCLGKKLTTLDIKRLANLRHEVGLPADVIFLLVRHCVEEQERRFGEGRRPTVSAVEKEGYYWARRGLFDQESAARYLRTVARRREQSVQYILSRFAFACSTQAIISFALYSFKTGNFAQSRLKTSFCISLNSLSRTFAHSRMCVPIEIPSPFKASFKIAPAATIPAVTRPEKCPPPL